MPAGAIGYPYWNDYAHHNPRYNDGRYYSCAPATYNRRAGAGTPVGGSYPATTLVAAAGTPPGTIGGRGS
jgi:hypothetical protein